MVINDKKNFVVKENLFYKKYYTLSELLEIKSALDLTIDKYKEKKLNDEIIKHLNEESSIKIEKIYKKTPKNKQGLYLMSNGADSLKIGITCDIKRRLKEISFANTGEIRVLFFIEKLYLLENIIHLKFDKYRLNSEWFKHDESILNTFKLIELNKNELSKINCKHILKDKLNKILL